MLTGGTTVIVGAGHAGFATASALRDTGVETPIVLVDAQDRLPYQRPPMSKAYLLGKTDAKRVAFRPAAFYDRKGITLLPGRSVTAIDRTARTARLDSGDGIGYENIVLATGARPRVLPVPGRDLAGVTVLRTMGDADSLRADFAAARRPVVIGGGFIGLEFAAVAAHRGTPVTVVEAAPRLLARSVSAATAAHLENAHRAWGNAIVTGVGVRRIVGDAGQVSGVELADGSVVTADLVVVGVGAVPDSDLAHAAGLAVDDGVLTDAFLRTSDANVFAVGDCARVVGEDGRSHRRESVQNATDQARAVARTIAGTATAYTASPWFWSDQWDLKLQIAGDITGHDETVTTGEPAAGTFSTYCFADGRLVAVESVNRPIDHVAARKLLERTDHSLTPPEVAAGFTLVEYLKAH